MPLVGSRPGLLLLLLLHLLTLAQFLTTIVTKVDDTAKNPDRTVVQPADYVAKMVSYSRGFETAVNYRRMDIPFRWRGTLPTGTLTRYLKTKEVIKRG